VSTCTATRWFGAQSVYRISFGNFLFFGALSLMLINVRSRSDPRDRHIHHGGWALKFTAWIVCNVLPFFFPNDAITGRGKREGLGRIGVRGVALAHFTSFYFSFLVSPSASGSCSLLNPFCRYIPTLHTYTTSQRTHTSTCRLKRPCARGYTWLARVGSGVFLVVQMVILLDFAFFWNESWVAKEHVAWVVGLLVSTVALYAGSITLLVYLYKWWGGA
jgi:hypothetical protein